MTVPTEAAHGRLFSYLFGSEKWRNPWESRMPPKPSSEFEAFADKLVESIREVSRQESLRLQSELATMMDRKLMIVEQRISDRIASLRDELREDIEDIKDELSDQSKTLNQHTKDIARMEQRLADGDQWMKRHEKRIGEVEEEEVESRISLAGIAAKLGAPAVGAGVGGGVVVAIVEFLRSTGH